LPKVLIVDDHPLIYDGLKATARTGFSFVHASNLAFAREVLASTAFDACVIDLSLGADSGLELLDVATPAIPCFMLTMHRSPRLVRVARDLGARGYFLKDEPLDLLFEAILEPNLRAFWSLPGLGDLETPTPCSHDDPFERLSLREKQIFVMLAEGLNYKEIAYRLSISPKTVNVHRDNIYGKMGFDSVAELVKKAISLKLVLLDE